jgi:hypothetical protein
MVIFYLYTFFSDYCARLVQIAFGLLRTFSSIATMVALRDCDFCLANMFPETRTTATQNLGQKISLVSSDIGLKKSVSQLISILQLIVESERVKIFSRASLHSKNHVVKFTTAKTYSVRFQKSIVSKILFILTFNSSSIKSSNSRER